jgi:CRP/FNR family transcriptional regulator, cyclic AMP receptor protein
MNILGWDHASSRDWARVLSDFPLFSSVSRRRLRRLVRHAKFSEFAAGDTVLSSGVHTDSLYIILGGTAKALWRPAARELGMGEYFGELALLDGAPRSATVVATQQLYVMRLPSHSVLQLARKEPAIGLTMLRNLSRQLRRLETQAAR